MASSAPTKSRRSGPISAPRWTNKREMWGAIAEGVLRQRLADCAALIRPTTLVRHTYLLGRNGGLREPALHSQNGKIHDGFRALSARCAHLGCRISAWLFGRRHSVWRYHHALRRHARHPPD